MSGSISQDFKFGSLMKFAFPSMVMMVFMSLYTIVDGIFVSRMVGSMALSSINIVFPVLNILMAVGIMLATGGSASIAKKLGEGKEREACAGFSAMMLVSIGTGLFVLASGTLLLEPLCTFLGATELLMDHCREYLQVMLFFAPLSMLQMLFQSFFVTADRPGLGLGLTIVGGLSNVVLDYLFMGPLKLGVSGAALATGIGQSVPAVTGLLFFLFRRKGLRFLRPRFDGRLLLGACFNGSSEMVTNLSSAVVTYLFNILMLRIVGEAGVAAITVVLYGQFLFNSLYFGVSLGVAPVFSYNLGAGRKELLYRVFRITMTFVAVSSVVVSLGAWLGAGAVAGIFTKQGTEVYELAASGGAVFAINYLFAGSNILASGIFTALSDGKTSALLSFLRTFVFIVGTVLFLPEWIGIYGVWLAIPLAEFLTFFVSAGTLARYFKKGKKKEEACWGKGKRRGRRRRLDYRKSGGYNSGKDREAAERKESIWKKRGSV